MVITLVNCMVKLQSQGLIPTGDGIALLESSLQSAIPLIGWMYDFINDTMEIDAQDGTTIPPALSNYGDVMSWQ